MEAFELCPCGTYKKDCDEHRDKPTRWPSGAELLAKGKDPAIVRRVQELLLRRATKARHNIVPFFNFVMQAESASTTTLSRDAEEDRGQKRYKPGDHITAAAHQRVHLDFVMAHRRSVSMLPRDHSKSFDVVAITLFMLGKYPHLRGAIMSATQGQALKPLAMCKQYIEQSPRLRLVFPELIRSTQKGDPWTVDKFTVRRPMGIRDPSLVALGLDSAVLGRRLDWVILDDLLNDENTATEEQRNKVIEIVDRSVLGTMTNVDESKVAILNTARHPQDVVHMAIRKGFATLRMQVDGNIEIRDDIDPYMRVDGGTYWDHEDLEPTDHYAPSGTPYCRLKVHEPDPKGEVPLWPERYPAWYLKKLRASKFLPHTWNQDFMQVAFDFTTAMCKPEWIEFCKKRARERGIHTLVDRFDWQANPDVIVFTGVDLAIQVGEHNDDTAFFTIACHPDGTRQILNIEAGKWDGPSNMHRLKNNISRYGVQVARVENNACFAAGTNVLTHGGYRPIETLRPGVLVWTHAGRWRPVTKVMGPTPQPFTTHVRAKGGVAVQASPTHSFLMREAGRTPGRKGGQHRPVGPERWISGGFADREAFVALAAPKWEASAPFLHLEGNRNTAAETVPVDEGVALMLGLYMAEGHSSDSQSFWTFGEGESHLVGFVEETLERVLGRRATGRAKGEGTLRVRAHSKGLAAVLGEFGKSNTKRPPTEWYGWPLEVRLAMVRGWLMGDGCLRRNNQRTRWQAFYFSGVSISRDWMLFARATLLEAGWRPALKVAPTRDKTLADGRVIYGRHPQYELRLPAQDSGELWRRMRLGVEREHWERQRGGIWIGERRNSGGAVVWDEMGKPWSRLASPAFHIEPGMDVWNLEVEDDESFVVEDMVVHNAQDLFRQFALDDDASLPVKPHTTTAMKAHPEMGIPGLFLEIMNGAWLIPNDDRGVCPPIVQRFVDACIEFVPDKHTNDVLMAAYFAQQQAREWGLTTREREKDDGQQGGSVMDR